MRARLIIILVICLFILLSQGKAEAVNGIPDVTQAATLVVPLMEQGISSVHNTLIVVKNLCPGSYTIHWEIWDIDGNYADIFGNETFSSGTWVSDFGTLLSGASPSQLMQLTDGSFYRGFMTIDMVTASTDFLPTNPFYPFSGLNCLTGFVYYVRLLDGAANGIPMVHIEGGLSGVSTFLRGFYQGADDREEIDADARYYTYLRSNDQAGAGDPDSMIDYIMSRVYLSPPNGESKIVIWAWSPQAHGTTVSAGTVNGGPFNYSLINESGGHVYDSTVNLNHIVNVINVSGTANGDIWITDIPGDFQIYAFSFNASIYSLDPALTWEVMFESLILSEWLP